MVCLWTETVDAGTARDALPATVVLAGCLELCCARVPALRARRPGGPDQACGRRETAIHVGQTRHRGHWPSGFLPIVPALSLLYINKKRFKFSLPLGQNGCLAAESLPRPPGGRDCL